MVGLKACTSTAQPDSILELCSDSVHASFDVSVALPFEDWSTLVSDSAAQERTLFHLTLAACSWCGRSTVAGPLFYICCVSRFINHIAEQELLGLYSSDSG